MENVIEEEVPHLRRIKSYVLREGRLTTGQERALRELWPVWGIEYEESRLDIDKTYGREGAPLTVEIGFGMGKSLVEMALKAPERNFLGIEVHTPGIGACLADIRDKGISNLRIVHHDAVEVLNNMIPDGSIDTLQLFFPDPWHKARHHKRRIVKPEFLDLMTKLKLKSIRPTSVLMSTGHQVRADSTLTRPIPQSESPIFRQIRWYSVRMNVPSIRTGNRR